MERRRTNSTKDITSWAKAYAYIILICLHAGWTKALQFMFSKVLLQVVIRIFFSIICLLKSLNFKLIIIEIVYAYVILIGANKNKTQKYACIMHKNRRHLDTYKN